MDTTNDTEASPTAALSSNEERTYPRQTAAFYLQLSVFWFALSFLWSGMITIVMQTLVARMASEQKDLYLGWTLALGALVSTIVSLVAGALSDRANWKLGKRRPYIIVGSLLAVPVLLWLAHVGSLPPHLGLIPLLMLAFCLLQFWVGVATSPAQALIPDNVPKEHQGTASAYLGLGSLVGQLGGLLLCKTLITKPNGLWQLMVTLSALLTGAMLFTVWRIPERSTALSTRPRPGLRETLFKAFDIKPREHPDFFWLIASRFVINMGFYSATEFLLYYVSDTLRAPHPQTTVGQILLVVTVAGLLGNFPAGILSDRFSKKLVVYVSTSITGVAALVFLLAGSIPVAMGAAFVFGMGFGAFQAVDWALATNLLPEHDEAKFMGVWHIAFTVPQVVAPIVGGVLAYIFNQQVEQGFGYRVVMFLVLFYLIIGSLLIRPIKERVVAKKEKGLSETIHPEATLQPQEPPSE